MGSNPISLSLSQIKFMLLKSNFLINFVELKYRFFYFFLSYILTFVICFEYKIELFFSISESFLKLLQKNV